MISLSPINKKVRETLVKREDHLKTDFEETMIQLVKI